MAGAKTPAVFRMVFSRLSGVMGASSSDRWNSWCPAHENDKSKKPSLSISIGRNGKLLLKCHAPCACHLTRILEAIGCTTADLNPNPNAPPTNPVPAPTRNGAKMTKKLTAAYSYRDAAGKLLFQACRFEPKSFSQRRPNPAFDTNSPPSVENQEWIWNMDGVPRVLFKLPELLAALAAKPERWVFIVEGEKDVELLWAQGALATCNPMGAGKWLPEFNEALRGRNVVVIPDNDPPDPNMNNVSPGKAHAEAICKSLTGVAKIIKYLELPGVPPKGDFSDWWAAQTGDDKARYAAFGELVKATPRYGDAAKAPVSPPPATVPPVSPPPPATVPPVSPPPPPATVPPVVPVSPPAGTTVPPPPAGTGTTVAASVESIGKTVAGLQASGVQFRSVAEWYGAMEIAMGAMRAALHPTVRGIDVDFDLLAQSATLCAAHAALGIATVPGIKPVV